MTLLFTGVRRALCVLAAMTIVLTGFSWVLTAPPSQAANPVASPGISAPPNVVVGEKPTAPSTSRSRSTPPGRAP